MLVAPGLIKPGLPSYDMLSGLPSPLLVYITVKSEVLGELGLLVFCRACAIKLGHDKRTDDDPCIASSEGRGSRACNSSSEGQGIDSIGVDT